MTDRIEVCIKCGKDYGALNIQRGDNVCYSCKYPEGKESKARILNSRRVRTPKMSWME